jgi:hypothetical protein
MPHATSYGPGWPFTLKQPEKKPAASSRRRSHRQSLGYGPGRASITEKGLVIDIDLHGVDHAFSGSMKLNYTKKLPDEVLEKLPTTALRFPVTPNFVYRAAGVRAKS